MTGEIETDLAHGIYRVDTPRAQAVAGLLGRAGMQKLSDVTVVSKNDYACVMVVSLDQKPIATSQTYSGPDRHIRPADRLERETNAHIHQGRHSQWQPDH